MTILRRWLIRGGSLIAAVLLLAVPLQAQEARTGLAEDIYTGDLVIPDQVAGWCWQRMACQQASHVGLHAGLSAGLDEIGLSGKQGFWASAGFAGLRELVVGPLLHQSRCGGPWCNEQLGPLDGLVDLSARVLGAYVGWQGIPLP